VDLTQIWCMVEATIQVDRNKMKSILLIVTVFPLLFLAKPCMAYITATSADLAFIDGRHKCDKPGLLSCYSITG